MSVLKRKRDQVERRKTLRSIDMRLVLYNSNLCSAMEDFSLQQFVEDGNISIVVGEEYLIRIEQPTHSIVFTKSGFADQFVISQLDTASKAYLYTFHSQQYLVDGRIATKFTFSSGDCLDFFNNDHITKRSKCLAVINWYNTLIKSGWMCAYVLPHHFYYTPQDNLKYIALNVLFPLDRTLCTVNSHQLKHSPIGCERQIILHRHSTNISREIIIPFNSANSAARFVSERHLEKYDEIKTMQAIAKNIFDSIASMFLLLFNIYAIQDIDRYTYKHARNRCQAEYCIIGTIEHDKIHNLICQSIVPEILIEIREATTNSSPILLNQTQQEKLISSLKMYIEYREKLRQLRQI